MRIIDLLHTEDARIESRLARLAASGATAKAWRGRKMLDLVRQLQDYGTEFEVYGAIWGEQLSVRALNSANDATVTIHVDWYDYAPLQDGKPVMHYRLRVRGPEGRLGSEARTRSPADVERFVREAFE